MGLHRRDDAPPLQGGCSQPLPRHAQDGHGQVFHSHGDVSHFLPRLWRCNTSSSHNSSPSSQHSSPSPLYTSPSLYPSSSPNSTTRTSFCLILFWIIETEIKIMLIEKK